MSEIYSPAEDSYLMSETLKKVVPRLLIKKPGLALLEVGCGSGINLIAAAEVGVKKIIGGDINVNAVKHCRKLGFNCVKSDLCESVKGKFDVIVFNPPYLPLDEREPKDSRTATTAGVLGNEIIIKFLKQAGNHLANGGKIFLITSSLSPEINFIEFGYKAEIINEKKLFFEQISSWELSLYI